MPPDVRKVYDLPGICFHESPGYAPFLGTHERWGIAATAHQTAEPRRNVSRSLPDATVIIRTES